MTSCPRPGTVQAGQVESPDPLLEHSTAAEHIFRHIDPQTVRAVDRQVIAHGQVHLDSNVGREAWRYLKARTTGSASAI
jgi:hypothetical protein